MNQAGWKLYPTAPVEYAAPPYSHTTHLTPRDMN